MPATLETDAAPRSSRCSATWCATSRETEVRRRRSRSTRAALPGRDLAARSSSSACWACPFPEEYEGAGGTSRDACAGHRGAGARVRLDRPDARGARLAGHVPDLHVGQRGAAAALYVPKLIAGEHMGAYGLTEPNAGSDSGGTQTTAVRDGDDYVLNGAKCFITNANYAGTFIVTAVTDAARARPEAASAPSSSPREHAGLLASSRARRSSACAARDWGEPRSFQDARIPRPTCSGPRARASQLHEDARRRAHLDRRAVARASRRAPTSARVRYAQEREAFGKPIAEQQAVAFKLADMAVGIEAARAARGARRAAPDAGRPTREEAAMAKLFAREIAMQVTYDAIQVHGGSATSRESPWSACTATPSCAPSARARARSPAHRRCRHIRDQRAQPRTTCSISEVVRRSRGLQALAEELRSRARSRPPPRARRRARRAADTAVSLPSGPARGRGKHHPPSRCGVVVCSESGYLPAG